MHLLLCQKLQIAVKMHLKIMFRLLISRYKAESRFQQFSKSILRILQRANSRKNGRERLDSDLYNLSAISTSSN